MKKLLCASVFMLPALAHAQVSPAKWSQHYIPTLGDWQAALLYNGQSFSEAMTGQTSALNSAVSTINANVANKLGIGAESDTQLVTGANPIAAATMARTLAERAMSMPQPHDFLTTGQTISALLTGGIDIGAIVNAAEAIGVRNLHIPCGKYKQTTTINLVNNFSIFGSGACTIISLQMATGNGIYASSTQYNTIKDLTYQADVTRTADAAIELSGTFEETLKNIYFISGTGKHWNDIVLIGANGTHMDHMTGRGASYDGLLVTGSAGRSEDTYLTNSGFDTYGNAPVELQWSSGFYADKLDLLGGTVAGVLVDPGSTAEVDGVRMTAVLSDTNTGPGWLLSGTGAITEFNITNCWGSTNGNSTTPSDGFKAYNANINDLTVASSEFHANYGSGVNIQSGSRILLNGNSLFMNSQAGSALYPGLLVGVNPDMLTATANQSGAGGEAEDGAHLSLQSYAIVSQMPSGHYGVFAANLGTGNTTGGFSITTSTNVTETGDVGY